jgi:hypothetical protein
MAFGLATLFTLAVMASVDHLAQPAPQGALYAHANPTPATRTAVAPA